MHVNYKDKVLKFRRGNSTERWRVNTIFKKEPATIAWIESFKKEDIFYDIGANIGIYSVFASVVPECKTYAFEPLASNYYCLCQNNALNNNNLQSFCLAVTDSNIELSNLLYHNMNAGQSHNDFKEYSESQKTKTEKMHGCIGMSVDYLTTLLPFPNHIKIDVDGWECKVFDGMEKTLKDDRLKSVFFEIDCPIEDSYNLIKKMTDLGFSFSKKQILHNSDEKYPTYPTNINQLERKLNRQDKSGYLMIVFFKDDFYQKYFDNYKYVTIFGKVITNKENYPA